MIRSWTIARGAATGAVLCTLLGTLAVAPAHAQGGGGGGGGRGMVGMAADTAGAGGAPSLAPLVQRAGTDSDVRVLVQRFNADRAALARRYDIPLSPVAHERQRVFHTGWQRRLGELDAASLNAAGRSELAELQDRIAAELATVEAAERRFGEMAALVPFARTLQALQEARRDRLPIDGLTSAHTLHDVLVDVRRLTAALAGHGEGAAALRAVAPAVAVSAADFIGGGSADSPGGARAGAAAGPGGPGAGAATLLGTLGTWYGFYSGYDPLFTWWVRKPYEELVEALEAYSRVLREHGRLAT
jgi:hypothetical protein